MSRIDLTDDFIEIKENDGEEKGIPNPVPSVKKEKFTAEEFKRGSWTSLQEKLDARPSKPYPLLFIIPKFNHKKFEKQLKEYSLKEYKKDEYTGDAIVLTNENLIYYIQDGVVQCQETTGINQKYDIPLSAKITDRHGIPFCQSNFLGSDLKEIESSKYNLDSIQKIIIEAKYQKKELIIKIVPKLDTFNRLKKLKENFHSRMLIEVRKSNKKSQSDIHPLARLEDYELGIVLRIFYKETVEKIISSDENLGFFEQEKYKYSYSPLSDISILVNYKEEKISLSGIYSFIQENIKKQIIMLFMGESYFNFRFYKKMDLSVINNDEKFKLSKISLGYIESFYRNKIVDCLNRNDLATAVAIYEGLKEISSIITSPILDKFESLISNYMENNIISDNFPEIDKNFISNLSLIQEEIESLQNYAGLSFDSILSILPVCERERNRLCKKYGDTFILFQKNPYNGFTDDDIILELIIQNSKNYNNKALGKMPLSPEEDECISRRYFLLVHLEIRIESVTRYIQGKKDFFLNLIEKRILYLKDEKNNFHSQLNSYAVQNFFKKENTVKKLGSVGNEKNREYKGSHSNINVKEKKNFSPVKEEKGSKISVSSDARPHDIKVSSDNKHKVTEKNARPLPRVPALSAKTNSNDIQESVFFRTLGFGFVQSFTRIIFWFVNLFRSNNTPAARPAMEAKGASVSNPRKNGNGGQGNIVNEGKHAKQVKEIKSSNPKRVNFSKSAENKISDYHQKHNRRLMTQGRIHGRNTVHFSHEKIVPFQEASVMQETRQSAGRRLFESESNYELDCSVILSMSDNNSPPSETRSERPPVKLSETQSSRFMGGSDSKKNTDVPGHIESNSATPG